MPGVFIDSATGAQALATTVAATFPGSPSSGNLMTAELFTKSDTSPTNPSGWTTDIEVINGVNADYLRICSKIAGAGESSTVTFTGMASDIGSLGIMRFSGMTATPIDKTASSAFATGVTSKTSGTTAATTQGDEVSIVAYGIRNVAITSPALTNSFIQKNFLTDSAAGSFASIIDGYFIETVTGAKESTASWTTSADPMGVIATYKAATAGNLAWVKA